MTSIVFLIPIAIGLWFVLSSAIDLSQGKRKLVDHSKPVPSECFTIKDNKIVLKSCNEVFGDN